MREMNGLIQALKSLEEEIEYPYEPDPFLFAFSVAIDDQIRSYAAEIGLTVDRGCRFSRAEKDRLFGPTRSGEIEYCAAVLSNGVHVHVKILWIVNVEQRTLYTTVADVNIRD